MAKYGYRRARSYFLHYEGKLYDSKAIFGVARGIEHHGLGPLTAGEFSGGENTVARKLRKLGFEVRSQEEVDPDILDPLVLAENEVTYGGMYDHWLDMTGVRYQFPNSYRNLIVPGRKFVYYRGVRRAKSSRGKPEYFGMGTIGDVWRDDAVGENAPKGRWKWFCSVEDYVPFQTPVPIKVGNKYFENIKNSMGWRTGVRVVAPDAYVKILSAAGQLPADEETERKKPASTPPVPPGIEGVIPLEVEQGLSLILAAPKGKDKTSHGDSKKRAIRRSKYSKVIGDRAEEIVMKWLRSNLPEESANTLRWLSRDGATPGWDIEYDSKRETVAIEVKGSAAGFFHNFEVTSNEWAAAQKLRNSYWVFLVSKCMGKEPRIQKIQDPYKIFTDDGWYIEATGFRIGLK